MSRRSSTVNIAVISLLVSLLGLVGAPAQARAAGLSVSPGQGGYVGGQLVTFSGNIGASGERRVHLQFNMGGGWTPLHHGRTWPTNRAGDFSFQHPAPAMFNVRYRVAARGLVTPDVVFDARSQDLVLWTEGTVAAGRPFSVKVDTTPSLDGRPDTPAPAFPGRTLTLQRRIDPTTWQSMGTTTTDGNGNARFDGVVVDRAGPVALRVVQADYRRDGHEIGAFPSFPTYVTVGSAGSSQRTAADDTAQVPLRTVPMSSPGRVVAARAGGSSSSAALKHGWRPALFDFAWEFGESLSSPPMRGTDRRGRWLDGSSGTGRAVHYNGGLMLDSQRDGKVNGAADQSWGATTATLRGHARARGRWETRLRVKAFERDDAPGVVRLELVPEDPAAEQCGARAITVAEFVPGQGTVSMGVRSPNRDRQWTRTISGVPTKDTSNAYAVELGRRHITWFWNGKAVASISNRAAMPRTAMTMRLTLTGPSDWQLGGRGEFNRTRVISDWQRGYSISRGKQVKRGPKMRAGRHSFGC
jgi:hypothetical protein